VKLFVALVVIVLSSCATLSSQPQTIAYEVNISLSDYSNQSKQLYEKTKHYFSAKGVVSTNNTEQLPDSIFYEVTILNLDIKAMKVANVRTQLHQQRQISSRLQFQISVLNNPDTVVKTSDFSQTLMRYIRFDASNPIGYQNVRRNTIDSLINEHITILYEKVKHFIDNDAIDNNSENLLN